MNQLEKNNQKKKIAVFFGGCSSEYDVSLQSAYSVITHINHEVYHIIPIGVNRFTGQWYWYQGNADAILKDKWYSDHTCIPVFPSMDRFIHGVHYRKEQKLQTLSLDAAFPVLHGKNGEDGTIQGVMELSGIPIIGCGLLSSALCMDKEVTHRIVSLKGIPTAKSVIVKKPYETIQIKQAALSLGYPLFIKPVRAGSSLGITKVYTEKELMPAVKHAFHYDSTVMLEEMIRGSEFGCAILGTKELTVGEIDEIELSQDFFDYTEKYTLKTSKIHVPARISRAKSEELKQTAITVYRALKCSCFARIDMFLTPDGTIYLNEVNTIPGFTSHSRYPNMLQAAGLSFDDIISRLLETVHIR